MHAAYVRPGGVDRVGDWKFQELSSTLKHSIFTITLPMLVLFMQTLV